MFKNKVYEKYHSNLSNCVLSSLSFHEATLTDVNFNEAMLTLVNFHGATLKHVNIIGAVSLANTVLEDIPLEELIKPGYSLKLTKEVEE